MSNREQRREIPPQQASNRKFYDPNHLVFLSLMTEERFARYEAAVHQTEKSAIVDEIQKEMEALNLVHVEYKGGPKLHPTKARKRITDTIYSAVRRGRVNKSRRKTSIAGAPSTALTASSNAPTAAAASLTQPVPDRSTESSNLSGNVIISDAAVQFDAALATSTQPVTASAAATTHPVLGILTDSISHAGEAINSDAAAVDLSSTQCLSKEGANISSVALQPPADASTAATAATHLASGGVDGKINLRVCNKEGEQVLFRVKPTTKFSKMFKSYALLKSYEGREEAGAEILPSSLAFVFDGNRIQEDETPQMLGMEDNDQIDVAVLPPSLQREDGVPIAPTQQQDDGVAMAPSQKQDESAPSPKQDDGVATVTARAPPQQQDGVPTAPSKEQDDVLLASLQDDGVATVTTPAPQQQQDGVPTAPSKEQDDTVLASPQKQDGVATATATALSQPQQQHDAGPTAPSEEQEDERVLASLQQKQDGGATATGPSRPHQQDDGGPTAPSEQQKDEKLLAPSQQQDDGGPMAPSHEQGLAPSKQPNENMPMAPSHEQDLRPSQPPNDGVAMAPSQQQDDGVVLALSQKPNNNGAIPPCKSLHYYSEDYCRNYKILVDLTDRRVEEYYGADEDRKREILTETIYLMDEKGIFFSDKFGRPQVGKSRMRRVSWAYGSAKQRLQRRSSNRDDDDDCDDDDDDDGHRNDGEYEPNSPESYYKYNTRKRKARDTPAQNDDQRKISASRVLNSALNREAATYSAHGGITTHPSKPKAPDHQNQDNPGKRKSPDTFSQNDGQHKLPASKKLKNIEKATSSLLTKPSWLRGFWKFATAGRWMTESFLASRKPKARTVIFFRRSAKNDQVFENTVVVNLESEGYLYTYLDKAKANDQLANVFGMTPTLKEKLETGNVYRFYEGKVGKFPENQFANMDVSTLFGLDDDRNQPLKLRIGYEKVKMCNSADLGDIE